MSTIILLSLLALGFDVAQATPCSLSPETAYFGDKNDVVAEVNRSCPRFYEIRKNPKGKDAKTPWDLLKVTLEVDVTKAYKHAVYDNPISVTINGKSSSLSFSLPSGQKENSLVRREVYLCPSSTVEPPEKRGKKAKKIRPARDAAADILTGRSGTHVVETRSADDKEEKAEDSAIVSVTTLSPETVRATFSVSAIPFSNFAVHVNNDKPTNLTAKTSDPWVRFVKIPEDVDEVRIKAISSDDLCATLAVQPYGLCPFISSEEDAKRAFRRLTFSRHGAMIVRRDEMAKFFVVVFTFPNDKECGNLEQVKGRLDKKKWVAVDISSVAATSSFGIPIALTLGFFALFYIAVLPIKLVKSLFGKTLTREENPALFSIRCDDDAMMDASVSRCVSPRPDAGRQKEAGETGKLISIDSPPDGSVISGEAGGHDQQTRSTVAAVQENFLGETSGIQQKAENATVPIVPPVEIQTYETEGLRNRVFPTGGSVVSDISCVLARETGPVVTAANPLSSTRWYGWIHLILCGFLLLVVIQLVSWFYPHFVESGDLDICYYNERCGVPLGAMKSFNHTFSNIGYVALGALALLILKKRYDQHQEMLSRASGHILHSCGLPTRFGMMTALGTGMTFQGLLSAVYHQCPNSSSIQFESISVYLIAMLALFKLYGARHDPTEPHVAYGIALAVWTLVTISSIGDHPALWWVPFCLMEMILMPVLSLQIYYHGHVKYSTDSIKSAYQSFRNVVWEELQKRNWTPLFKHRLTALAFGNALNILTSIIVAVSGTMTLSEYILSGLIVNFILYFVYYLANKIAAREPIPKLTWFYLVAALAFWLPALKYFFTGTINWKLTAAQSRALNQECSLFGFYDSHDAWHLLSSVALFFSFMSLLTLDDEMQSKRRGEIAIF